MSERKTAITTASPTEITTEKPIKSLTAKQQQFVEYYCGASHCNATKAARLAGYAHPNKQGPELLVNLGIRAAISARFAESSMNADEALTLLARQARASLDDALEVLEFDVEETDKETGETKIVKRQRVHLSLEKARETGLIHHLASAKYGRNGLELKLVDTQGALDKILRGLGIYQGEGAGVTVVIKNYVGGDLRDMV